jgi:hypothetical protein
VSGKETRTSAPEATFSDGVRHAKVADPDGNAISFAEPPDDGS